MYKYKSTIPQQIENLISANTLDSCNKTRTILEPRISQKRAETYSLRGDTRLVVGLDLGFHEWDELRDKPPLPPDSHSASAPDSSERHTPRRRFSCTAGSIRLVSATGNRIRIRDSCLYSLSTRTTEALPTKKSHSLTPQVVDGIGWGGLPGHISILLLQNRG